MQYWPKKTKYCFKIAGFWRIEFDAYFFRNEHEYEYRAMKYAKGLDFMLYIIFEPIFLLYMFVEQNFH